MSTPAPINAVDISGYILLGTKRLNIHITLEDADAGNAEAELDEQDQGGAEFDEPDDLEEDDLEQDEDDAEFDEPDEDEQDEDEADFDDQDEDPDDPAAAQASLRHLLRPRPRRHPDAVREESEDRSADEPRSRPRRRPSSQPTESPDRRSRAEGSARPSRR
jgi:hypothetical protein